MDGSTDCSRKEKKPETIVNNMSAVTDNLP